MVMSISANIPAPAAPGGSPGAAATRSAQPLGGRLAGKLQRLALVSAAIATTGLLVLPSTRAQAAVTDPAALGQSVAGEAGLQPVLLQREGRRGGGEFRGSRGGGGNREFRAQNRSAIGTARIDTPREFRQERRADRQDFRQERQGDVRGFRQERRGDRQDFRQERRADRQDFRQGELAPPAFRADRRDDRRDFRQDRRVDRRDFQTDRRDDRRDFRQDRRFDNRDFRGERRGYSFDNRRGFDNRGWNSRGWDNRWRNDRRYDWYGYRNQNRNFYRAGRYYAPVRGWNYRRLGIGFTLGAPFYASSFWITDPWSYRLPPAYGQYRWVRYFGDVLLVDIYTGEVVDVVNDFFW